MIMSMQRSTTDLQKAAADTFSTRAKFRFVGIRPMEYLTMKIQSASALFINCFYIALFSTLKQTHCACKWFHMSDQLFIACFWISTIVVYLLTVLIWLVLLETAAISACSVCITQYNHAPCHFRQSHICKVHACLTTTCHMHVWQNECDVLRATAVTWGWNGYQNKSRHKKLTQEEENSPATPAGTWTRDLSITSPAL